ncbi:MAG TPA: response regulator, partial [Firmicutes bacterium]|nr:response regulator [Bacillota bacterium]
MEERLEPNWTHRDEADAAELTVLVVDDDEPQRLLLEHLLSRKGYSVASVADGQTALEYTAAIVPDVILLDVILPDMDGFEVCRRIRATESLREVYILMLTGLSDREARLQGFDAGADDFVSKPFDSLELTTRMRAVAKINRFRRLIEVRDRNTVLAEELQKAYNATLEGWSAALELRDHDTQGHTRRVANMTIALASHIGVDEEDKVHIYRGALLHDIGKIGIPDSILHKAGALTDEERELMRQHPIFAYDMLKHITYLRKALEIPYCHHEWWSGEGYPRGISGEEIPLSARVFAVVDVWDALSFNRPYRNAL